MSKYLTPNLTAELWRNSRGLECVAFYDDLDNDGTMRLVCMTTFDKVANEPSTSKYRQALNQALRTQKHTS